MINNLQSERSSTSKAFFKTVALSLIFAISPHNIGQEANNKKHEGKNSKQEIVDPKKIANYYDDKGKNFYDNDQLDSALQNYVLALKNYEQTDEIKNKRGVTKDIGKIKYKEGKYDEAMEYFEKAMEILKDTNYLRGELITKVAMAAVYNEKAQYDMALKYLLPGLEILKKQENKDKRQMNLMTQYLIETGNAYYKKNNYPAAEKHRQEAKEIAEDIGELQNNISINYNLGDMHQKQGNNDEAIEHFQQGIQISQDKNMLVQVKNGYEKMYFLYKENKHGADSALKYLEIWTELKDSLLNEESMKFQKEMLTKYESEKKDNEIKLQKASNEKQQAINEKQEATNEKQQLIIIMIIISGLLIVITVTYGLRTNNKKKKIVEAKNEELKHKNEEITTQNEEIEAQMEEIVKQKNIIEEKNTEITDSINYAKNIQSAILPPLEEIREIFPLSFIFFKPKDVVSGDFYRASKNKKGKRFIAAPDCTGHGVPGAFMSILNCDSLDDAVNREDAETAADILNYVNQDLPKKFHQVNKESDDNKRKDTMDVALCAIDENNMIEFALAKNPAIVIRKGECIEFKEEKHAIGSGEHIYTNKSFQGEKGDMIYLFSDGFEDQFGGPKGKKFLVKNLKELFIKIAKLPMLEQEKALNETFQLRRGNLEQVDDVLVIGVRV